MKEFLEFMSELVSKIYSGILKVLHLSRFANHPEFKPTLNTVFLTFSCLLIIASYTRGIKDPLVKFGAIIVLTALDIAMQWILGLAKAYWKAKHLNGTRYVKSCILIIFWLWYISVFAIPTGVGFFKHYLSVQKTQIISIDNAHQRYQDLYDQNKRTIEDLQAQLKLETKSIHGERSKAITTKLENLTLDQVNLNESLTRNEKENEQVSQVVDQSMKEIADVLKTFNSKFTEEFLTLLACFSAVAMIYLFLALTAWEVFIGEIINDVSNEETSSDDFKKELLIFLDALFEGRNKGGLEKNIPLNGIAVIANETGMPKERCFQLRKYLSELKVNGDYAIRFGIGFCKANYSKEFIRDFIIKH
jgi:hypothetical protein